MGQTIEPATGPTPTVDTLDPGVRHRRRNIAILAGALGLDGAENGIINALFPVIQAALGLATSALGLLVAAGRLAGVVAAPLGAVLARRYGRRRVLAVFIGLWGGWAVAAGLSQEFWQLLLFYSISAAGVAVGSALAPSIVADSFPDAQRGRATGWLFGTIALTGAVMAPLIGQLSRVEDGWRYGFFGFAALNVVFGILVLVLYRDPATGSAEPQLADLDPAARIASGQVSWARVASLLRVRSFALMLVVRLLSGNSVLGLFGVVLLVQEYGFATAAAAAVLLPYGVGYLAGNVVAGFVGDALNRRSPAHGRVSVVQAAQFAFAGLLLVTLQIGAVGFGATLALFAALGLVLGFDAGPSRPIVMAVTPPELRPAGLSVLYAVETAGITVIAVTAGFVADAIGVSGMLMIFGVAMVALRGVILTLLQVTYRGDAQRVVDALDRRRAAVLADPED